MLGRRKPPSIVVGSQTQPHMSYPLSGIRSSWNYPYPLVNYAGDGSFSTIEIEIASFPIFKKKVIFDCQVSLPEGLSPSEPFRDFFFRALSCFSLCCTLLKDLLKPYKVGIALVTIVSY